MKLFRKISIFAIGAFMAIGAGIFASRSTMNSAKAATVDYTSVALSDGVSAKDANNDDDTLIRWTMADGNITITQSRGTAKTAATGETVATVPNTTYISAPRVYVCNVLTFETKNNYKILGIKFGIDGTYYGNDVIAGLSTEPDTEVKSGDKNFTGAIKPVVDSTKLTFSKASDSGGTHVVTTVDTTNGASTIYVQNHRTSNNTNQFRIKTIQVKYIEGTTQPAPDTITVSGSTNLTIGTDYTFTASCTKDGSATNVVQTVVWSVSDNSKAIISATGILTPVANGTINVIATSAKSDSIVGLLPVTITGEKDNNVALTFDKNSPIANSGYDTNLKTYGVGGVAWDITKVYTNNNKYLQFQKNNGKLVNRIALPYDVTTIQIVLNVENEAKDYNVKAGATSSSTVSLAGTTVYENMVIFTPGSGARFVEVSAGATLFLADSITFGFGNENELAAVSMATEANDLLDSLCANLNVTSSAWETLSSAYSELSAVAKAVVNGNNVTGYVEIVKFIQRYDHIVTKYGYSNFMNRTLQESSSFSLINNSNNVIFILIAVITSVSTLGAFLIIKKKKTSAK